MKEEWVPIKGFESSYEISNLGRVKSLARTVIHRGQPSKRRERILAIRRDGKGYHQVRLYKDGASYYPKVHRIVAEHFIPNDDPLSKDQINHIDQDKDNNSVDNLEWCDMLHNMDHAFAKNYVVRSPEGEKIEIRNLRRFCMNHGLQDANIHKVLNGTRRHHRGYTLWET